MFKKPFSFEGRIRRTEYGLTLIILAVIRVFVKMIIGDAMNREDPTSLLIVDLLINVPLIYFVLTQGAKRCHDTNKSGWFQLIPFFSLYLLFADGTIGKNEYGEDPKPPPTE